VPGCRLVVLALVAWGTECRSAECASAALAMGCRLVGMALVASGTGCMSAAWVREWVWVSGLAWEWDCTWAATASASASASASGCGALVSAWACRRRSSAAGTTATASPWAACARPWEASLAWWGSVCRNRRRSRCRPGSPGPGSPPPGPAPAPLCHPFSPTLLTHCKFSVVVRKKATPAAAFIHDARLGCCWVRRASDSLSKPTCHTLAGTSPSKYSTLCRSSSAVCLLTVFYLSWTLA
jgi:hypothetical protein